MSAFDCLALRKEKWREMGCVSQMTTKVSSQLRIYILRKTQKGLPVMYDYNGRRIDPKEARARVTDRLGNGSRSTDGKYGDN